MLFRTNCDNSFARSAVGLLFTATLLGHAHGQAPSAGISGAAGNKLRDAMSQQDPSQKLHVLQEAEPLFSDPVSKYSVLYPNLIDAYLGVNDQADAKKLVDEMASAGVQDTTEAESRLHLATAYVNTRQYDPALQQLNAAVLLLKSTRAKNSSAGKIQQDLATALEMQGEVLLETGSAPKAIAALRESEELRKSHHLDASASVERNIARCYVALDKQDDALESFGNAYSLAAHRANAIQRHMNAVGKAASAGFAQELADQQELLKKIQEEIRPVYGTRNAQVPLERLLAERLDTFDKALIADAMSKAKSSKPAPDFNLPSVAGTKTKLSELRGKVVLLNFWDITCKPCRAEYPHLQKIQDEFRSKGLSVVMISLDEDATQVKPFAEKYGFLDRVLLKGDTIQHVYGIGPIPHTVIIDPSGVIRFNEVGFTLDTPDIFRAEIATLLPQRDK